MRKLLLLPAVGAAAALTYGAAAALNVTGSAPIQVGTALDLTCAEAASVAGWGYDDHSVSVAYAWVDVTDVGNDCDGRQLYLTPLDAAGNPLALIGGGYATGRVDLGVAPGTPDGDGTDRVGNVTRYQVYFGTNGGGASLVSASLLEGVRIGIDQGVDVGPDL